MARLAGNRARVSEPPASLKIERAGAREERAGSVASEGRASVASELASARQARRDHRRAGSTTAPSIALPCGLRHTELRGRRMEEAPRGGGIELAVVLRFVDIATDALAGAREEIDALNVYPVPDGDTGTNMYLTDLRRPRRDQGGRQRHPPRGGSAGPRLGAHRDGPGRAARCAGQLRRDPQRDARRDRPPDGRGDARGAQRVGDGRRSPLRHRGELRRRGRAGRGHHAHGLPGRLGGGPGAGREGGRPSPRRVHQRRAGGPRSTGAYAGTAARAARGGCRRRRRAGHLRDPRRGRDRAHRPAADAGAQPPRPAPDPDPARSREGDGRRGARRRPDGRRAGVRGDVPARGHRRAHPRAPVGARCPRRLAGRRRWRRSLERPRARRRRRRGDRGRHRGRPPAPRARHPLRGAGR